ncbi:MAG TPA: serine hydrolase domain-containing protein [Candidatus Acidoferrales bacterium]|nr:serine hydrolase domain-containing protein [Candidatus Acidoferrales bacterium]
MKRVTPLFGLILWWFTLVSTAREIPVVAPAQAGLSETKLAEVDRFMERQVAERKLAGGVVIIWHAGKIGFFHAYGLQDREAQTPMAPDTIFRIYSMSKAVTTAAALNLYDAGKLGLDDPVSKYIPSFANLMVASTNGLRPPARPVTIRDLMLHISGLTYGDGPEALREAYSRLKPMESTNLAEMAEKLSQVPLAFDPETDWNYGVSIDVLGRVIEVVSGKSLEDFLAQTIFQPLDMKDTGFSVPPEKLSRFAANYARTNGNLKVIDVPAESKFAKPVTFFSGGGGLVSTARDYMRFLATIERGGKLDGHRILRAKTVQLMSRNLLPPAAFPIHFGREKRFGTGFGLGFAVCAEVTNWDPAAHAGEFGWDGAASTHDWISPADNLIVVTLEQIMPYEWDTERGVKQAIYDAIQK